MFYIFLILYNFVVTIIVVTVAVDILALCLSRLMPSCYVLHSYEKQLCLFFHIFEKYFFCYVFVFFINFFMFRLICVYFLLICLVSFVIVVGEY